MTARANPPMVDKDASLHSLKKTNQTMKHTLWIPIIALPLALGACKQKETITEKMDAGAEKVVEGLKEMGDAAAEEAKEKAKAITEEAKEAVESAAEKAKTEAEEATDAAIDTIREVLPEPEEPTPPN